MMPIRWMRIFCVVFVLCAGAVLARAADEAAAESAPGRTMARQATQDVQGWTTVDHSRLDALKKPFASGKQVTEACVSCHSEAASQFHQTIHWTWLGTEPDAEKRMGKAGDSLNNFCISANNMQDKSCNACHPSWNGQGTEGEVNCLVCHGRQQINWTEAFDDLNAFSGSDDPEEQQIVADIQADIQQAVQSVILPARENCGSCHFYGGGGDGVKHGDLDSSIAQPPKSLDVHMGVDGKNFQCTRCHTTVRHNVAGRIYSRPAAADRKSLIEDDLTAKITCESCHSATPHKAGSKANDHTDRVACQSCHIPLFARQNPTKTWWDWSKAGTLQDGKKYNEKGEFGKEVYMTIKGEMKWEKDVKPEYFWFNGSMNTLTIKDFIDPEKIVAVSAPVGSREDKNARIFPFKIHGGKQPYDTVQKVLLAPMLSGKDGYWETLDWQNAIEKGMQALNASYSGSFDFVETTYAFPITHMVAPRDNVVRCAECHTGQGSRLASLTGFYMPGRDRTGWIDTLGWLAVLGALAGVALHGLGRAFSRKGGKES